MKKKGLSGVVTALILILLALVAIFIVWLVITNLLEKNSDEISLAPLENKFKIESAKASLTTAQVKVKRENGDSNLTALRFIISGGENSYTHEVTQNLPKELETKIYLIPLKGGSNKKVTLVPVFGEENGLQVEKDLSIDYSLDKTLVAYWKFDKDFKDETDNNYDGTGRNGTKIISDPQRNKVADFDGIDDSIQESKIPPTIFSDSYSISAWINVEKLPLVNSSAIIQKRGYGQTNSDGMIVGISSTDNSQLQIKKNAISFMKLTGDWVSSTTTINEGTWYHLTVTYNSSARKSIVYVNGVKDNERIFTSSVSSTPTYSKLSIGGAPELVQSNSLYGTGWSYLNGSLDDLAIFNRTLDGEEVNQIYLLQK